MEREANLSLSSTENLHNGSQTRSWASYNSIRRPGPPIGGCRSLAPRPSEGLETLVLLSTLAATPFIRHTFGLEVKITTKAEKAGLKICGAIYALSTLYAHWHPSIFLPPTHLFFPSYRRNCHNGVPQRCREPELSSISLWSSFPIPDLLPSRFETESSRFSVGLYIVAHASRLRIHGNSAHESARALKRLESS